MTMHEALHPRDDVDYLYQESRLTSIEGTIGASRQRLEDYIEKHEGGLITAIRNDTDKKDNRIIITKKQKSEEKQLYGRLK